MYITTDNYIFDFGSKHVIILYVNFYIDSLCVMIL